MSAGAAQFAGNGLRLAGITGASVVMGGFFGMIAVDTAGLRFMTGVGGLMGCMVGLVLSSVLCWGLWRGAVLEGLFVVAVPTSIVAAIAGWLSGKVDFPVLAMFPTAVAYAGLSVWWGVRQRRALRQRVVGCARCDYDLSGNVTGVCPECGARTQAA